MKLYVSRWADKSLSVIEFENGGGGVNADHTPIDAMVNVVMSHFINLGLNDTNGVWPGNEPIVELQYKRISWFLDEEILEQIEKASLLSKQLGNQLLLKRSFFTEFGKEALVTAKVNPDTFVQMCIQLAYIRLHKKPGDYRS